MEERKSLSTFFIIIIIKDSRTFFQFSDCVNTRIVFMSIILQNNDKMILQTFRERNQFTMNVMH